MRRADTGAYVRREHEGAEREAGAVGAELIGGMGENPLYLILGYVSSFPPQTLDNTRLDFTVT